MVQEHRNLKMRRQKVSNLKFKFTKDMVNERFIKMLQEEPAKDKTEKPNVLQTLLAKTKLGKKE